MSCCAPGAELDLDAAGPSAEEILLASRIAGDGLRQTDLSVPDMHCGACMQSDRGGARRGSTASTQARANLSARRVSILWRGETPPPMIAPLAAIGYAAHLFDADADRKDPALSKLLRALAVAGFAASNIMLLSVSVWSGADGATRDIFHWISAADRAAGAGLFRTGVLPLGLARAAPWPDQHGRADLDRRAARLRHEPVRDRPPRPPRLFRRRGVAAVLPPDRPHARSRHARARAAGGRRGSRGSPPRGALVLQRRRHADLSSGRRDRARHDHPARGRRARAGRRPRHQGTLRARSLAGLGRKRAAAGGRRHGAAGRHRSI